MLFSTDRAGECRGWSDGRGEVRDEMCSGQTEVDSASVKGSGKKSDAPDQKHR